MMNLKKKLYSNFKIDKSEKKYRNEILDFT